MSQQRRGVVAGVVDTTLWATTVLYWPHLRPATDSEILAHRLVWACVFMAVVVVVTRRTRSFRALLRNPRSVGLLVAAALSITVNWAGFIWGANHGHVVGASLGFFINPLVTVLLGVAVLGERLRPGQLAAIGLAAAAVVVVTVDFGHPPWFALLLAVSGGLYGLCKKKAAAGAFESLALETLVVAPIALVFLLWQVRHGRSTWLELGLGHALLLVGGGLVTIIPLTFFGYAATRVPLVTLGVIGYLAPIGTFTLGITYFGERLDPLQWVGYLILWVALLLFTVDSMLAGRRRRGIAVPVRLAQ